MYAAPVVCRSPSSGCTSHCTVYCCILQDAEHAARAAADALALVLESLRTTTRCVDEVTIERDAALAEKARE
jgi:hypothetical protein